jgi:uncharacterized protein with HEPN domain
MTQHDPIVRMKHMRDHAREGVEMLGNRTLEQLRDDRVLQLALVQLVEIVGEAASRIPQATRDLHPSIPWQLAADMRNKLIHGYDVIEYEVVFDTVKNDLPALATSLDPVIAALES